MHPGYESAANKLVERILELIPKHPEILKMDDPWALFKIKDFTCGDINPSLFQASWALQQAKYKWKSGSFS